MDLQNLNQRPGEMIPGEMDDGSDFSPIQRDEDSFSREATPEEVQELRDLLSDIEEQYEGMRETLLRGDEEADVVRRELVKEIFQVMGEMGVDLNNIEEVREFLDDLQEINPELYELFIMVFNIILEDGSEMTDDIDGVRDYMGEGEEDEFADTGLEDMGEGMEEFEEPSPGLAGMAPPSVEVPPSPSGAPRDSFPNIMR